jgi:hypothetical protein
MSALTEGIEFIASPATREIVSKFLKSKKAERVLDASIALFEIGVILFPLIKLGIERGKNLVEAVRTPPPHHHEEERGEEWATLSKAKQLLAS